MDETNNLDKETQERSQEYRSKIAQFTLMHDILMRCVFKDKACVEFVLRVILENPELQVISHKIQDDYKNLWGRSCILDCVACDSDGRIINIEVQQEAQGASPKRARYHASLLDMRALRAGDDFDDLPETYVIIITRDDTFGYGQPIHAERKIVETGEDFGDLAHIIYVPVSYQADNAIGHLMHDFACAKPSEMYSNVLAGSVRQYKETDEGVSYMCREIEELVREGEERAEKRGEQRGELKKAKANVLNFYRMGLPVEQIAAGVDVDIELAKQWIAENA